jgi:hypothetical protein
MAGKIAGAPGKFVAGSVSRFAIPLAVGYALTGDMAAAGRISSFQSVLATTSFINSSLPTLRASKLFSRVFVPSIISGLYSTLVPGGGFLLSAETMLTNTLVSLFTDELARR